MNLLRCSNGHYYDGDRYKDCPFCSGQNQAGDFDTVDFQPNDQGASVMTRRENSPADPPTQKKPAAPEQAADPLGGAIDIAQQGMTLSDDEGRTVSYYDRKIQEPVLGEPVVGWLVCTKGRYFGQSFALKSGRNFIGRSDSMDVILKGEPSVSRDRHAVVVYEPRERIFIAQPVDSRELFYVNDKVVLDNVELKPRDEMSIGKISLLLIPFCTKEFAWEDLVE